MLYNKGKAPYLMPGVIAEMSALYLTEIQFQAQGKEEEEN